MGCSYEYTQAELDERLRRNKVIDHARQSGLESIYLDGRTIWACTHCGCLVAPEEQFIEVHIRKCPGLSRVLGS